MCKEIQILADPLYVTLMYGKTKLWSEPKTS